MKIGMHISANTLQKFVLVGILFMLSVALSVMSRNFSTMTNISNVSRQIAVVIITGSAVTLLMISGNLDLSVGSVLALSGVLSAKFAYLGFPLWIAILMATSIGGIVGLLNGFMVVKLKISAVIATLGTMYVARGMTFIVCSGVSINRGLPDNFSFIGTSHIGPVPFQILFVIAAIDVFDFLQAKTVIGKYSVAIGGNKTAAMLSGINVGGIVTILYVLSGLLEVFPAASWHRGSASASRTSVLASSLMSSWRSCSEEPALRGRGINPRDGCWCIYTGPIVERIESTWRSDILPKRIQRDRSRMCSSLGPRVQGAHKMSL